MLIGNDRQAQRGRKGRNKGNMENGNRKKGIGKGKRKEMLKFTENAVLVEKEENEEKGIKEVTHHNEFEGSITEEVRSFTGGKISTEDRSQTDTVMRVEADIRGGTSKGITLERETQNRSHQFYMKVSIEWKGSEKESCHRQSRGKRSQSRSRVKLFLRVATIDHICLYNNVIVLLLTGNFCINLQL